MISLFKACMGEEEIQAVAQVLRSGWTGLGPKVEEFERKFGDYLLSGMPYSAPNVVGLNSCTAALDLALKVFDIHRGDEVIVPTMTFVSTAHAVAYNLATPIFADVNYFTLNIDPEDVARKITQRTKAIICVHYGGRICDMKRLLEVAGNIPIIEDCAHACGSSRDGIKAGMFGDMACFSFHAVKNLSMGDGGALVCHDEETAARVKALRWLGIDKSTWDRTEANKRYWWEYQVNEIGLKCHMNDISAAIGIEQLKKLDAMNARRREIVKMYREKLTQVNVPDYDPDSSWHLFCVNAHPGLRDELVEHLKAKGITTGVHYKPIHLYSCYGNRPSLPEAESAFLSIMSLPLHPGLTDEDVQTVIDAVEGFHVKKS